MITGMIVQDLPTLKGLSGARHQFHLLVEGNKGVCATQLECV